MKRGTTKKKLTETNLKKESGAGRSLNLAEPYPNFDSFSDEPTTFYISKNYF